MPDAYTIGLTNKPEYAYLAARAVGAEISSLGFNMDFAPVADIFKPGKQGYRKAGIRNRAATGVSDGKQSSCWFCGPKHHSVLKHFPGHGDTAEDTHTGAAFVDNDLERLMSFELVPFKEGLRLEQMR